MVCICNKYNMNKRDCYFKKQCFIWNRQNAVNKTGNLEDVVNPPKMIFCYLQYFRICTFSLKIKFMQLMRTEFLIIYL